MWSFLKTISGFSFLDRTLEKFLSERRRKRVEILQNPELWVEGPVFRSRLTKDDEPLRYVTNKLTGETVLVPFSLPQKGDKQ